MLLQLLTHLQQRDYQTNAPTPADRGRPAYQQRQPQGDNDGHNDDKDNCHPYHLDARNNGDNTRDNGDNASNHREDRRTPAAGNCSQGGSEE
jgi:hypothetical protein